MRPRVVIADLDRLYLLPLQQKFVKEFYSNIDLEIITERDYFNQLFEKPQMIDILIVSEQLYSSKLQKHGIKNLYIMSENETQSDVDLFNGNYIYKYTSIIDIFDKVTGSSSNILNPVVLNKVAPKIITFYSANGGAGKTTLALSLCSNLASRYKRVLYINAERLQVQNHLYRFDSDISFPDYYASMQSASSNVYSEVKPFINNDKFDSLPVLKLSTVALGIPFDKYADIAVGAKKSNDYDYIIIDGDSVFDTHKADLISLSDQLVVVYEQTKQSIAKTNAFIKNIDINAKDKYLFICNKHNDSQHLRDSDIDYISNFETNERLEYLKDYDMYSVERIAQLETMQKIAYLVM